MKCVFGCDASGASLHYFPNPKKQPNLTKKWLDIITHAPNMNQQVKTFLEKLDPTKLNNSIFRVCDHHFKREHKTPYGRIMYGAVPSINLHAILQSLPWHMEHNYSSKEVSGNVEVPSNKPFRYTFLDNEEIVKNDENAKGRMKDKGTDAAIVGKTKLFSWQRDSEIVCDEPQHDSEKTVAKTDNSVKNYKCTHKENIPNADNKHINSDQDLHEGYKCDMCKGPIYRFRYACVQCVNYDLCGDCEGRTEHAHHYLLRVPRPKPYGEVQQLIDTMKQILAANIKSLQSRAIFISNLLDKMKSEVVSNPESDPLVDVPDYSYSLSDDDEGFELDNNASSPSSTSPKPSVSPTVIPDPIAIGKRRKDREKDSNATVTPQKSTDHTAIDEDKHIPSNTKKTKMDTCHSLTPVPNSAATSEMNSYPEVVGEKEELKNNSNATAAPQTHTDEAIEIDEDIIWLDEEFLEEHETPQLCCDNTKKIITIHPIEEYNDGNKNFVKKNIYEKKPFKPRILRQSNNHPSSNTQGKVNKTSVVALPKKASTGSNLVYTQDLLNTIKHSLTSRVCIQLKRLSKEEIKFAARTLNL